MNLIGLKEVSSQICRVDWGLKVQYGPEMNLDMDEYSLGQKRARKHVSSLRQLKNGGWYVSRQEVFVGREMWQYKDCLGNLPESRWVPFGYI